MSGPELTATEQAVQRAFCTGEYLAIEPSDDPVVRSSVLRFLLLGGVPAQAGHLPALRLAAAHITGQLQLAYADIVAPISLRDCRFDEAMDIYGAQLRQVSLRRCEFPGLIASNATFAANLRRVGAIANLCDGFVADGTISLNHAQITSRLCFDGAALRGGQQTRVELRHLQTRDLLLLPTQPPAGTVDLSHARVGLFRDDPSTWPPELLLDGLIYEALTDAGDRRRRLDWLRRDRRGYRPQTYGQLAAVYRGAGRDDDAREVLLAGERHRRETLSLMGRAWGHVQDLTVGYGYRPGRALGWLAALLVIGSVVFELQPPHSADADKAPDFVALAYTADLILPVVDLGQQSAYHAEGATVWLTYLLILTGLVFATTIAAAAARRLRRS